MLQSITESLSEFPPVEYQAWRAVVENDLQGAPFERKLVTRTYEGIDIQPLYTAEHIPGAVQDQCGYPGLPPFTRGGRVLGHVESGWDIRQAYGESNPARANRAILDDLSRGATSIELRIGDGLDDPAAPGVGGGIAIETLADLEQVLADVDLSQVCVAINAGGVFLPAAALLAAVWKKRSVDESMVRGAFNADPLAALASAGCLPVDVDRSLAQMAELAAWTVNTFPKVTAIAVDAAPYHDAGASAAQDLAFSMATGIEYLRAMERAGLDANTASRQILFRCSIGCRLSMAIAKLRAARRLWARVVEACGGDEIGRRMSIQVRTGRRVLTSRDPWVNMLRNTVCCFAGAVAGADVITTAPFDAAISEPDEFSRRVARNTQLLLREESHLHRVVDPAAGSWFIEKLTEELAERAWAILQEIEGRGGMAQTLQTGWVAEQIDATYTARLKNLATRRDAITGVSEFPNLTEDRIERKPLEREAGRSASAAPRPVAAEALERLKQAPAPASAVEAALAGATLIELSSAIYGETSPMTVAPLPPRPYAAPYEALRDASDAHLAEHGHRPSVFLANMGSIAQHTARATWSNNFFEAGGFEVVTNDGFADADAAAKAFVDSAAHIAVICSSDKLYETVVAEVAPKLKEAGAQSVILAGRPGEREEVYRAAGVDRFIFLGCDVLATLRELLAEEGVLS
jgi:methylmalonyl-CoA mutase